MGRLVNVSRVIRSSFFEQGFAVKRKSGDWVDGYWQETEQELHMCGVVTVAKSEDLDMLPVADRQKGMMCFHVTPPDELFVTREEGTSDQVVWQGKAYKIIEVRQNQSYGYIKALGAQMEAV